MHEACVHHARCVAFAPQDVANTKLFKPCLTSALPCVAFACLDMPWLWLALPFPLDLRLWLALPLYTFGFCLPCPFTPLAFACVALPFRAFRQSDLLKRAYDAVSTKFFKTCLAVPKMWLPSYSSHALPSLACHALACGDHDVA
ncbi:hypothetical protein GBA52_015001 [Prunus armeniaca]|nr:hypothetical protein GBA52_015001 [Prunus armeniaca]